MNTALLPLQQHPNFAAALKLMGRDVRTCALPDAAPVQIIRRFGVGFVPRGPIWTTPEDIAAQTECLRNCEARIINSDGTAPAALTAAGFRQVMTPAHVAEMDLSGTIQDREMRMKGKWRNTLRRARGEKIDITHMPFNAEHHNWLLAADLAQQKEKRFRALPHSLIHALATINPNAVQVYVARLPDAPIAAMLFLQHGPIATYHLGWSNAAGRKVAAHHRILMQAADDLARSGTRRLDLGTIDTANAPGLARFKIGSGATLRTLGGTWVRLPGF